MPPKDLMDPNKPYNVESYQHQPTQSNQNTMDDLTHKLPELSLMVLKNNTSHKQYYNTRWSRINTPVTTCFYL